MNARTIVLSLSLLTAVSPAPLAQTGKKVFICADMEGISGVSGPEQTGANGAEYGRARKLMAEDVNAAIRGAVEGGATTVVVIDSHGSGRNILREDLEPPATLISYNFRRYGMMEGLDETFDAVLFVGNHAKAGSPVGVFAHTQNGNIRDVHVNGKSVGEGGINSMLAAWFGVPVVMVTGDQVAVAQVKEVATDARGVVVKRAINGRAVELRPVAETRAEIQRTAKEAVAASKKFPPQRTGPYRIQVWYRDVMIPEVGESIPTVERPTADSLAFSSDSFQKAFALYRVLHRHINPD
jgi:D-amino peptidase